MADTGFVVAGRPPVPDDQHPQAMITRITPSYFASMGIPVRRGRPFTDHDGENSQVTIISETLANRYFGAEDPVGQRLLLGQRQLPVTIVGVVGDVKHITLQSVPRPEFYVPMSRFTSAAAGLVVRTAGDAAAWLPAVQRRVWTLDSNIPANLASPVERLLYASLAPARIAALLLAVFAGTTLLLGLVGVYGVLSYSVRRRTREIGVRLALGASTQGVLRMVLQEALGLSAAGVTVGLVAALIFSRYLNSLLFGVSAMDTATYAVVSLAVPCAALLAAWYPAHRAASVDPSISLRSE
jgi:putative ABC transport system permease protein